MNKILDKPPKQKERRPIPSWKTISIRASTAVSTPTLAVHNNRETAIIPTWALQEMLKLQTYPDTCQYQKGQCQCVGSPKMSQTLDCTAQKADILWRAEAQLPDGQLIIEDPPSHFDLPNEFEIYLEEVDPSYWLHIHGPYSVCSFPVQELRPEDDLGDAYDCL